MSQGQEGDDGRTPGPHLAGLRVPARPSPRRKDCRSARTGTTKRESRSSPAREQGTDTFRLLSHDSWLLENVLQGGQGGWGAFGEEQLLLRVAGRNFNQGRTETGLREAPAYAWALGCQKDRGGDREIEDSMT